MLTDEVIEKVTERLVNRVEKTNEYILKEIGRSIKEIGTFNPTKAQQLIQTMKYGGSFDKIVKKLSELTELNTKDIYKIFEEVAKNDYRFAKVFYQYRNIPYIPYEENYALQEQVRRLARVTAGEYLNITKTTALGFGLPNKDGTITFKGLQRAYYDLIDEAVLSVSQGKETFDSAMYRQLKNIGESGLKVVYPTGYTRRLDSAVRMNLKSGLRNLHNETQKQIGYWFGADGVEISVHSYPAPDHQDAQGKQFSYEEYNKLQTTGIGRTYDGKLIDMYIGSDSFRPISEWNCYHYDFSIILGVNKPQYTNEQLQQIIDDNNKGFDFDGKHYTMYEGSQLQRKMETAIREQKDTQILAKSSGNEQLIGESQNKIRQLSKKYKQLSEESGLPTRIERTKVDGYKRVNQSDTLSLLKGEKVIKAPNIENNAQFYDATNEWIENAQPGNGKVIYNNKLIDIDGNSYEVDGKNVIMDASDEEIQTAYFLKDTFGDDVYLNPKVNYPNGVESADYIWRGESWDRKNIGENAVSLTRAVDNSLKDHKRQSSNFILDITKCKIDKTNILFQTQEEFRKRDWINKIILIDNYKTIKIYTRK